MKFEGKIKELEGKIEREEKIQQLFIPLDVQSKKIIRNQIVTPITVVLNGTQAATSGNYGVFFVNRIGKVMTMSEIVEVHGTAGTDAGDVTLQIERLQNTESSGNGNDLLSIAFNLKGTANTIQNGDLVSDNSVLVIEPNDRLGLSLSGTPTNVDDLIVTVYLQQ